MYGISFGKTSLSLGNQCSSPFCEQIDEEEEESLMDEDQMMTNADYLDRQSSSHPRDYEPYLYEAQVSPPVG